MPAHGGEGWRTGDKQGPRPAPRPPHPAPPPPGSGDLPPRGASVEQVWAETKQENQPRGERKTVLKRRKALAGVRRSPPEHRKCSCLGRGLCGRPTRRQKLLQRRAPAQDAGR